MPNIKISALPPALLPLDDPNTLFEVTVLEAGEEVSRKISLSEISGATGLDASFLTLSVNAQLPNERVLTEGTNITFVDTGPGGTLTINSGGVTFPLLAPDDTAGAPSYSWSSNSDLGMFRFSANTIGMSVGGVVQWEIGSILQSGDNAGPAMQNSVVSGTLPGLLPKQQDTNTGIGSAGLDIVSIIGGGEELARATQVVGSNQFAIAQSGSSSVPDLTSLADGDTGFRWPADNTTVWIGGGSRAWNFSTAKFFSQFSNGPALINTVSQNDVPTVVPDHADENTGMGSGGGDELSLIAGGVEGIRVEEVAGNITVTYFGPILVPFGSAAQASVGFDGDTDTGYFRPVADAFAVTTGGIEAVRWAEISSEVLQTNSMQTGITASITQTQGQQPLISSYNEVSIVANPNDTVTAPSVTEGLRLTILNNGGNTLQVFPASGDNIGAGVDTAITIDSGETGVFLGRDATNWDTLFNASAGGVVFPLLAPDGSAAAPSYSFAGDTDIGMFRNGADILSFSARSTEMLQVVGALGANQVIAAPGAIQNNQSAPDLALGDGDTGIMQTVDDTFAIVAGANQAVRWAEASASIIQTNASDVGLTASVTQTQAGGLVLLSSYNEVSTVATTGDALTAMDVFQGHRLYVINNGVNDLQLFPAVGDDFGAGVDTAITIVAGEVGVFLGRDSINWDVLFNGAASAGNVSSVGTPVDNQIAVWTGPNTIEGDANFTWDGAHLNLPQLDDPVTPTLAFGDGDTGLYENGDDLLRFAHAGVATWAITGTVFQGLAVDAPNMSNAASSGTVPNIRPNRSDGNTGLGSPAVDQLSLIAGGVQIAQAVEVVSANQFIIAPGVFQDAPATPSLAFGDGDTGLYEIADDNLAVATAGVLRVTFAAATTIFAGTVDVSGGDRPQMRNIAATLTVPNLIPFTNDLDTGIGADGADAISVIAGGVSGVQYAEASSRIIQTNANHVGLTASVTQTQAGGLALLSSYNEIATVANNGDAITAFAVAEGSRLIVVNNGANELQLFPAVGDNFGAGVDLAITIDSGHVGVFIGRNATSWDTLFNSNPNIEFPGGATISGVWKFDSSTVEADPGAGNFRNDNATIGSVTEVFISGTTETGFDANNILGLLGNGDQIYIQNKENAAEFLLFDITANVDNTGWFSLAGTVNQSGSNFTDGAEFGILLLFGGTGAPAIPVANDAVQARRTTVYVLTTAFVDITMDTTDIETDSAVLDHDLATNTDNIIIGASGTYECTVDMEVISTAVSGDPIIDMGVRVRLNDAGTGIAGSLANPYAFRDGSVGGADGNFQVHVSNTFVFDATAADFITLQLDKTELSGSATFNVSKICMKVRRLL